MADDPVTQLRRRRTASIVVGVIAASLIAFVAGISIGRNQKDKGNARVAVLPSTTLRPIPVETTPAPSKFPIVGAGGTITLTVNHGGTIDVAKVTVLSARYDAVVGSAVGGPTKGGYLVLSVRVACVSGICDAAGGRFVFHAPDGRDYFRRYRIQARPWLRAPYGPGEAPLTAGQHETGFVMIDAPHAAGIVYLVGNEAGVVVPAVLANPDLYGAAGGWKLNG